MAAGRIRGITIEVGGDTTKLTKALAGVDNSIKTTQSNIRDLDKALKLDPSNTELLKDKQIELANEIEATKKKLETEKQALDQLKQSDGFDETSQEARNLKVQIDLDTAALKDLEKQAKDSSSIIQAKFKAIGDKCKEVGDSIKAVGDKISGIGQEMTTNVTVPIIGAFGGAVKAAVDWETAFTGVKKTVEGTDEEYEQLADAIKQMATETASSKEDIAGVMEISGQLGVTGVDNLTNFTKTMVMLGDTTNLSADEAATSLARFMNITGESYTDSDKLGSSIVDLGNNFATSESEIVEMATRLAAAGTIAGLSSTDILALSASMSSVGINAEAGGTAMTQTLTAISKAVGGLDNSVEDVEKAQNKVNTASRALESAQDNLKKKQIAYNEAVKKYGQSDAKAQESAQKKVETATNQLANAQANAEKKQLAYDAAVQKYGADSTQAQTALINLQTAQVKVDEKNQKLTDSQNNLNTAMAGGSTSDAAVQKALIDLQAAERKVQDKTDDLTVAQGKLAAVSEGSSGKLEIMAKVAGMSADEFSQAWETNPINALNAFISGLSKLDGESESTIKILEDLEMDGIRQSNMLQSVALASDQLTAATETSNAAYEENSALQEEANKRYETTAAKMSQMKERVTEVAIEIGERLMPYVMQLMDWIGGLIEKWDALDDSHKELILKIALIAAAVGPVLVIIGKIVGAIGTIVSAIGVLLPILASPVGIVLAIIAAVAALAVAIYMNWDKIKAFLAEAKEGWDKLVANIKQKIDDLKQKFDLFKQAIGIVWNAIKEAVVGKVKEVFDKAKTTFSNMKTNIQNTFTNIKNGITNTVGNIKNAIVNGFGKAVDFIKSLPSKALSWGKDLIQNFVNGIWNKIGAVTEVISNVADKVKSFLGFSEPEDGPLSNFHTFAPDMIKLFAQGIEQSLPMLERATNDMAAVIASDATPSIQNGQAAASKTVNAPISINVYGAQGQDVNQLADIIQAKMNRAVVNQKAVFA